MFVSEEAFNQFWREQDEYKDYEDTMEDLLNQIREETTIINKASDRILRIQSAINKVQRRMSDGNGNTKK
jgi:predicted  nucleic acid-binding Zn-ribbon protein